MIRHMNKTNRKSKELSYKKKIALYSFFLAGLTALYAIYVPCLLDYYIIRPEETFLDFFYYNHLSAPYMFEGIFIGMVLAAFYCLTRQAGISALIVSGLLFLLTHASYIKFINRKELLRLDDLRLTEAAGMALNYFRFTLDRWVVILAGGLLFFVGMCIALDCFGDKVWKAKDHRRETAPEIRDFGQKSTPERARTGKLVWYVVRFFGFLVLCVTVCLYTNHFLRERYVIDAIGPLAQEMNRYVLYRFLQNDSLSEISVDRAEESYEFLLAQSPPKETPDCTDYPDIIVIMNESWWNTDNIPSDRITFSQDPMGPYKALADRCSTGYLTSPVFGGGTVSPEIEFLTGLNTKYYRADAAYGKLRGRKIPSVVDYFNGLDYETTAIHPYYGSFYGRDAAYADMGFDRVVFEDGMQHKEIYTRYISDESLAEEIMARARQEDDRPQFIWAVSMANHIEVLDYKAETKPARAYGYPITVTIEGGELSDEDYDIIVNYINGIYRATRAFAQLVDYFSKTEQPAILLMFGDHCPFFSEEALQAFGLGGREAGVQERLYSTPVIMWSNVSAEKLDFSGESIYYLPQMVIDYAGLPDSDMTRILRYERSYFKTNSPHFARNASGEIVREGTEEQIRALNHYKTVQYDLLEGDGIGKDVWKPITGGW